MIWEGTGGCELPGIDRFRKTCGWISPDMLVASLALGKTLKSLVLSPPVFWIEVVIPAHLLTFQKSILNLCVFVYCSGNSICQTFSAYSKICKQIKTGRHLGEKTGTFALFTMRVCLSYSQYLQHGRFDPQVTSFSPSAYGLRGFPNAHLISLCSVRQIVLLLQLIPALFTTFSWQTVSQPFRLLFSGPQKPTSFHLSSLVTFSKP